MKSFGLAFIEIALESCVALPVLLGLLYRVNIM